MSSPIEAPSKPPPLVKKRRTRASKACLLCHKRKVRCYIARVGSPCSNCTVDQETCIVPDRSYQRSSLPLSLRRWNAYRSLHCSRWSEPKTPSVQPEGQAASSSLKKQHRQPVHLGTAREYSQGTPTPVHLAGSPGRPLDESALPLVAAGPDNMPSSDMDISRLMRNPPSEQAECTSLEPSYAKVVRFC